MVVLQVGDVADVQDGPHLRLFDEVKAPLARLARGDARADHRP